ncbi:hypothetical protein L218DRAFT_1073098 [Marasmius fiardii PR-910]|nr:hypothetical protein L218DRAFT_1073098 [Marasmius fiardii PR-910]
MSPCYPTSVGGSLDVANYDIFCPGEVLHDLLVSMQTNFASFMESHKYRETAVAHFLNPPPSGLQTIDVIASHVHKRTIIDVANNPHYRGLDTTLLLCRWDRVPFIEVPDSLGKLVPVFSPQLELSEHSCGMGTAILGDGLNFDRGILIAPLLRDANFIYIATQTDKTDYVIYVRVPIIVACPMWPPPHTKHSEFIAKISPRMVGQPTYGKAALRARIAVLHQSTIAPTAIPSDRVEEDAIEAQMTLPALGVATGLGNWFAEWGIPKVIATPPAAVVQGREVSECNELRRREEQILQHIPSITPSTTPPTTPSTTPSEVSSTQATITQAAIHFPTKSTPELRGGEASASTSLSASRVLRQRMRALSWKVLHNTVAGRGRDK